MSHDASQFSGLDTGWARQNSRGMDASAQQLGSMVANVTQLLGSVVWVGPAAHRFKQDWDGSLSPELQAAQQSLAESASELHRRADLQDEVSR